MHKFWREAAECLVAALALISLTAFCYRLHLNLTAVALLFVIVVVLVSRAGSFASSIVTSVIAALCLALIAPPRFTFRVDDPLDELAIAAFVTTSFIVARLIARVRNQADEALSSVSFRVIEAEERERYRIAYYLHEDIAQRLSLLANKIEQFKPDSPNTVGTSSQTDILYNESVEVLKDVKTLAHELYSPRLEYIGIAAVMRSFCRDFGNWKRVQIEFSSEGLPGFLAKDVALCLFRVLQEALHNALQHSGVRQFDARLWATPSEIHLTISDHGVGFDFEATRSFHGLGLNRMRERLKLVKGKLSVESKPRRGTTIHACVPVGSGTDRPSTLPQAERLLRQSC